MQARIVALRQEEDDGNGSGGASYSGKPKENKVSDDVMLAKLSNDGWAEHVTNETDKG